MARPPKKPLSEPTLKDWWFVIGRNPKLSLAELKCTLPAATIREDGPLVTAVFSESPAVPATELIKHLGGTIKIAEVQATALNEEKLLQAMEKALRQREGKIIFGLSLYEHDSRVYAGTLDLLARWGKHIKELLKTSDQPVRYVESREATLSSASVEKNNLVTKGVEFLIYASPDGTFSFATTLAVQPFEAWGERDFGRPGRDDVSGMLPPKLALMLINLTGANKNETLLDPFCGSGTILTEALLLGFEKIIGSDISEKAVADTKQNILWQQNKTGTTSNVKIFQSDASELGLKLPSGSVAAIATEPYLGKPLRGNEPRALLEAQIKELKKIYLAAFAAFAKILTRGAVVVFVIPCFDFKGSWLRIDCKKEIERLGFTTDSVLEDYEYILYARPKQRVGREIWRFKKN